MTADQAPDPAVQIAAAALGYETHGRSGAARDMIAALARAGWLHDPAYVAALEATVERAERLSRIETTGWGVDKITLHWIGRWLKYGDEETHH